jgi:hypothetical protein
MENPSKYLTAKLPHIRFYNGVWRASKQVAFNDESESCILEMWGRSPSDAWGALQRAIAVNHLN